MSIRNYDQFLADVLRKEKTAFGFVAHPAYQADLPGELVWLLIRALVREKGLTLNQAARVVLDFTERKGHNIPNLMSTKHPQDDWDSTDEEDKRQSQFPH